jgi:ubiquitin-protein ligase
MIEFNCPHCQRLFRVPDELAGRSAKCKSCGGSLTVPARSTVAPQPKPIPQPQAAVAAVPRDESGGLAGGGDVGPSVVAPAASAPQQGKPAARVPMRTRRLLADAQHMAEAFRNSTMIRILETQGEPPDLYRVEYHINSLGPTEDPESPEPRDVHQVEIQLTADYPRVSPQCKMLTPAYHPNIDPSHICVGDHWAAGERLVDLVIRIGEMLAYQAYNIQSPLDAHAAMWADLNPGKLPTDSRTIRPAELE